VSGAPAARACCQIQLHLGVPFTGFNHQMRLPGAGGPAQWRGLASLA
jgi:hypothetical protein